MSHRVWTAVLDFARIKDGLSPLLFLICRVGELLVLQDLVHEVQLALLGGLTELDCFFDAVPGLLEVALGEVASVGPNVGLCKFVIEVEGLLTVEESFFVLSLLDIGHGSVGEHALALLELWRWRLIE